MVEDNYAEYVGIVISVVIGVVIGTIIDIVMVKLT